MKGLSRQQIDAVLRLPGPQRYKHFVKQVVDGEEAWGLYADGWALAGSEQGEQVFPLWPAKEYASLNAEGLWANYEPRSIPFGDLLAALLPSLDKDGVRAGVFYTPEDKGVVVDPSRLSDDLLAEEKKYE